MLENAFFKLIKLSVAGTILVGLFAIEACEQDPAPITGLEIFREQMVGRYAVDRFSREDEGGDLSDQFNGVTLDFQESGRLLISGRGGPFEEIWDLRSSVLFINVDLADSVLRTLNGLYIAEDTSATQLSFSVRNPRTPGELILRRF